MTAGEVEAFARIKLPGSARALRTYTQSGQGRVLVARVEIDTKDLPVFLQEAGLPPQLKEDYRPPGFARPTPHDLSWWDVLAMPRSAGVEDRLPNGTSRRVVVAHPSSDVVVVYLNVIRI